MNVLSVFSLVIKIIFFALCSWFLIHILAVFGIFFVVAYPIWWWFGLKRVPCFWCLVKKNKEECTFSHTLKTSGLILIFTLVSLVLVFAESKILFKMGFPPTPKTVSFIIPSKGQYRLGEIFPMKIDIAGIKTPINAVQADLGFDPGKLEVVEISTQDSFANIFIQKEINNEVGYARLTGGLPNPGYSSDHGIFGTVYFKGKNPGITKVEFLPSSKVLANDGRGTDVVKELTSASYLILPEKLTPEEEKQQEVLLQPVVLGEEVKRGFEEQTQMIFYEENEVLGLNFDGEATVKKGKFNLVEVFLKLLESFDRVILSLWSKVFSLK